jgi:hypothetical protein
MKHDGNTKEKLYITRGFSWWNNLEYQYQTWIVKNCHVTEGNVISMDIHRQTTPA